MSKRPMARGGGAKPAPPRSPAPAVGSSSFTDGGVAQHVIQHGDLTEGTRDAAGGVNSSNASPGNDKFYDKHEGNGVVERLYEKREDDDVTNVIKEGFYMGRRFAPNSAEKKNELLKKVAIIAGVSK